MSLSTVTLYKNVKITRDYSVVHDMTPTNWLNYLKNVGGVQSGDPSPPQVITSADVNFYRLPDTIRIEGKFDDLRQATYGSLTWTEGGSTHCYFFWVDSVRLVKQCSYQDPDNPATFTDVAELTVANDIWSNKFTDCKLYDSFVVRRHEERWYRDHSDPDDPDAWVYHPRYFPNASDDVGGAYEQDGLDILLSQFGTSLLFHVQS